jgi:flavin-dependent dehydrogenase
MDEGATLVIHTPNADGWFWYIPLNKDRVSVGIVSSPESLFGGRKDPLAVLEQEIERCAPVRERVKAAARCLEVRVTSDFSFRSRRIAGDGWVLVGDAFGFLDPIYSSGVFLALKSGEMAADAIGRAFSGGDFSAATLGSWAPKFTVGMEAMRKLVYAFYTPGFSFKQFLMAHPQCKKNLVDLLIGDVFKEGITDIFGPMGEMCDLPAPVEA